MPRETSASFSSGSIWISKMMRKSWTCCKMFSSMSMTLILTCFFLLLERTCARKNTMREQRRRTNIIWESWLDKEQKHRWKLSVTSTSGNTIQSLPLLLPSHWQSQFTLITTAFFLLVRAHHVKIHDLPSICLLGRYNKFSRNLPQTPWIVDGERKLVTSLEELIVGQVSKLIKFQG